MRITFRSRHAVADEFRRMSEAGYPVNEAQRAQQCVDIPCGGSRERGGCRVAAHRFGVDGRDEVGPRSLKEQLSKQHRPGIT
jgi:hypothetical protein